MRGSSLAHCREAFPPVGCLHEPFLLGALPCHRPAGLRGELGAHRGANRADGQRRGGRDLGGQRLRLGPELSWLGEPIGQADRAGRFTANPPAGIQQVEGGLLADGGGQGDAEREALMNAQQGEIGGEASLRRRHPEVCCQGETKPATDGCALDRGDNGQGLFEQADGVVVQVRAARAGDGADVGEVGTSAEDAACAAQDDRAAAICSQFLAGISDLADQSDTEVVAGRPIDLERGDIVGELDRIKIRHQALPAAGQFAFRHRRARMASRPRGCRGREPAGVQEPPEVTAPVPELADGADVLLRPLPEADELDLPPFDVDEVEPDELELAAAPDEDDELWVAAATACVDPGRV